MRNAGHRASAARIAILGAGRARATARSTLNPATPMRHLPRQPLGWISLLRSGQGRPAQHRGAARYLLEAASHAYYRSNRFAPGDFVRRRVPVDFPVFIAHNFALARRQRHQPSTTIQAPLTAVPG
jgi:hypothetical protein